MEAVVTIKRLVDLSSDDRSYKLNFKLSRRTKGDENL